MSRIHISINGRLVTAMSFLGILLVVTDSFGLAGMVASNNANRHTYSEQLPKSIAVGEMTIMVGRQRTSLDRAAINPGSRDALNMYGKDAVAAAQTETQAS